MNYECIVMMNIVIVCPSAQVKANRVMPLANGESLSLGINKRERNIYCLLRFTLVNFLFARCM